MDPGKRAPWAELDLSDEDNFDPVTVPTMEFGEPLAFVARDQENEALYEAYDEPEYGSSKREPALKYGTAKAALRISLPFKKDDFPKDKFVVLRTRPATFGGDYPRYGIKERLAPLINASAALACGTFATVERSGKSNFLPCLPVGEKHFCAPETVFYLIDHLAEGRAIPYSRESPMSYVIGHIAYVLLKREIISELQYTSFCEVLLRAPSLRIRFGSRRIQLSFLHLTCTTLIVSKELTRDWMQYWSSSYCQVPFPSGHITDTSERLSSAVMIDAGGKPESLFEIGIWHFEMPSLRVSRKENWYLLRSDGHEMMDTFTKRVKSRVTILNELCSYSQVFCYGADDIERFPGVNIVPITKAMDGCTKALATFGRTIYTGCPFHDSPRWKGVEPQEREVNWSRRECTVSNLHALFSAMQVRYTQGWQVIRHVPSKTDHKSAAPTLHMKKKRPRLFCGRCFVDLGEPAESYSRSGLVHSSSAGCINCSAIVLERPEANLSSEQIADEVRE